MATGTNGWHHGTMAPSPCGTLATRCGPASVHRAVAETWWIWVRLMSRPIALQVSDCIESARARAGAGRLLRITKITTHEELFKDRAMIHPRPELALSLSLSLAPSLPPSLPLSPSLHLSISIHLSLSLTLSLSLFLSFSLSLSFFSRSQVVQSMQSRARSERQGAPVLILGPSTTQTRLGSRKG